MRDTLVCLDTPELREKTIGHMLDQLKSELKSTPKGTVEARTFAVLAEVMPPFIRALDRERKVFETAVRTEGSEAVNDMLMLITQVMINMLGATLMTMVRCTHPVAPCEECIDVRMALLRNVIENLFGGTASAITSPVESVHDGKLHA